MQAIKFIDLFAGAGRLSEGFLRAGCTPVTHVEMNKDTCNTLRTRTAFHGLKKTRGGILRLSKRMRLSNKLEMLCR